MGVFIFRLKRLEDHQERNKCKFPRLCPGGGGGIMHNHITPGVGVEVLKSCRVFLTFSELLSLQRKSYDVNIEIKDLAVGTFTFN